MENHPVKFVLRNKGKTEYNDHVFEEVFDLRGRYIIIRIQPGPTTRSWRLGIVFSRTVEFNFDPTSGRYADRQLKYLELDVGQLVNGTWGLSDRLQLGNYHISTEHVLTLCDDYQSFSPVDLRIDGRNKSSNIDVSFASTSCSSIIRKLDIEGYRYFKVFGWADFAEFELACTVSAVEVATPKKPLEAKLPQSSPRQVNFWLLRLNTETWNIRSFYVGIVIWHSARNGTGQKRTEYNLYQQVSVGDTVIGYAFGRYEAAVCLFSVERALHNDETQDEVIHFVVTKIFSPFVRIGSTFRNMTTDPGMRLLKISRNEYDIVMKADYDFPKIAVSSVEKQYLEITYLNLIAGTEIESTYSLQEIWNELPSDFKPLEMSHFLVSGGRNITLIGICQIHPESDLFIKFDMVIYAIRKLLSGGSRLANISQDQLFTSVLGLSATDVVHIFRLMLMFSDLCRGYNKKEDGSYSLTINDDQVYEAYRTFKGLKDYIHRYSEKNGIKTIVEEPVDGQSLENVAELFFYKTNSRRRKRKEYAAMFGVNSIAEDLGKLIYELPGEKGEMIGLFGKWGRGKTFFLDRTWEYIEGSSPGRYIKIEYDAWKYQETPASWAYLYELMAERYLGKNEWRNWCSYYWRLLRLNLKRLGWMPILKLGFSVLFFLACIILPPKKFDKIEWYYFFGGDIGILLVAWTIGQKTVKKFSTKATELIKKYSVRQSFKSSMGLQADIQVELIKLLKVWIPDPAVEQGLNKILLLVEDLDRCTEDRIMQNIDALRVLLEDDEICKRLVIIAAIDERILKNAIQLKYKKLISEETKKDVSKRMNELTGEYIDKLFVFAMRLGGLSADQRVEYLEELVKHDVILFEGGDVGGESTSSNERDFNTDLAIEDVSAEDEAEILDRGHELVGQGEQSANLGPQGPVAGGLDKLLPLELNLVTRVVRTWSGITPRQVIIFYYRYLFCKNLLIGKYLSLGIDNNWQDQTSCYAILQLIKFYSTSHQTDSLFEEKERLMRASGYSSIVANIEPKITKSKNDYLYLLEILELVVAY